jgi:outer membrane protein TolC
MQKADRMTTPAAINCGLPLRALRALRDMDCGLRIADCRLKTRSSLCALCVRCASVVKARFPAVSLAGSPVRRFAVSFAIVLLLIGSALAEVPARRVLTLEEALRISADQNKDIQKAREFRTKVLGRYYEERAAALPQVTGSAGAAHSSDESQKAFGGGFIPDFPVSNTLYNADVGVSQVLFTWGQVGAAIRAAKEGMADADDQLRIYQQAVARDVSATFYDVLLAREFHTVARQNLEQKTRHLEEAKRKYDAGTATDYDVLAAEVAVENARPEVIRTENMIRIAQERLGFMLGLDTPVDATGSLEAPVGAYPRYEDALEIALRSRPDLSELEHQSGIARELVKIAAAGNKPRLDFRSGFGWRWMGIGGDSANGLAWTAGVYMTFPAYDGGRTKGRLIQARSDVASLEIEKSKLADTVSLQVHDAVNAVETAGEIVKAVSGTVAQAERLVFMAEKGFEFGVKTRLDVEDAQQNLNEARVSLSRARRDYLVARVTLEWVTGQITP